MKREKKSSPGFVVCVRNGDYPASLEPRKIYQSIADVDAEKLGQLRIIDESGEDYLYPSNYFMAIELPLNVRKALGNVAA